MFGRAEECDAPSPKNIPIFSSPVTACAGLTTDSTGNLVGGLLGLSTGTPGEQFGSVTDKCEIGQRTVSPLSFRRIHLKGQTLGAGRTKSERLSELKRTLPGCPRRRSSVGWQASD